jgi:hypothetical protein
MLTPALAEQRRPQAFRERETRAARRKKKTLTRPSWNTQTGTRAGTGREAPALLPSADAPVMVFDPLYITAKPPGPGQPADGAVGRGYGDLDDGASLASTLPTEGYYSKLDQAFRRPLPCPEPQNRCGVATQLAL